MDTLSELPTQQPLDPAHELFYQGVARLKARGIVEAEALFRSALQLQPDLFEALVNLGYLLYQRGCFSEAEPLYQQAYALNPKRLSIVLDYGALLTDCKKFAEAEVLYQQGLEFSPQSAQLWSNLGVLYACMRQDNEAEICCRMAVEIDPLYANGHYNLGYVLLRRGHYREGWPHYEKRDWYAMQNTVLPMPRWQGEPIAGKSILIIHEAGFGDMIQFCRYASVLKEMGARQVDVLCAAPIQRLFATLRGVDHIRTEYPATADTDFWTPPLSLPGYCQTRMLSIPTPIPYLQATADDQARWAPQLPPQGLRVGLVWKGRAEFENDRDRSLSSLSALAPLAAVAGISFVSLQKGPGENELDLWPAADAPLCALGNHVRDFADTAAIVAQLDLVISVDTAVAHLAGALGIPCWILLPQYKTDWRWHLDRSDSPWYPSARLFRQEADGLWAPVITTITAALHEWVAKQTATAPSEP